MARKFIRSPSTESARRNAVVFNYKLPKESFELYHSATQHVKPKKNAPMAFFVFVVASAINARIWSLCRAACHE